MFSLTRHTISSRTARCMASCLLFAFACGDPPPKREWTPADHGQPAGGDPDRTPETQATPEEGEAPLARAAAALWNASCASCHGRDGRGLGAGRPPGVQIADFTAPAWQASRSDAQLVAVIRDGRSMMPAFGKQVNEHGLGALVEHIRRFAPVEQVDGGPSPSPPTRAPAQAEPATR